MGELRCAFQAQATEESDLNVLAVQFIIVAVRLLVEAAFSEDKGWSKAVFLKCFLIPMRKSNFLIPFFFLSAGRVCTAEILCTGCVCVWPFSG